MAFSTFVFDTLDVATRLGRFILQDLSGWRGRGAAVLATAGTSGPPLAVLLTAGEDSYKTFWTLFGTANQLLAALTLLGVSVWLKRSGRRCWYTVLPMLFMMTITAWALLAQIVASLGKLGEGGGAAVAITGSLLMALAALLAFDATRALLATRVPARAP